MRRLLATLLFILSGPALAGPCETLVVGLPTSGMTITAAVTVPGPAFTAPDGVTYTGVPAFCKLSAVLTPTSDSFINVELWMPSTTWNGKFQGVGNGGYAGTIAAGVPAMVAGLQQGYAVASTDMGTAPSANNNADVLVGHPQKWIDWGWRATHLMTTTSKQLIQKFYGQGPRWSYFNGCSTGGQQGLMTAQRYPDDYDGILVGAPANNRTHVHTGVLWNYAAIRKNPQALFFSGQTARISASIAAVCAVQSGGVQGDAFLTDPRTCNWDPAVLQCTGAPDGNCLLPEQVEAARKMYAGPRDGAGRLIYPGVAKGSEADTQFGWSGLSGQAETPFGSLFKWVFGPAFTYSNFNFDTDMATVDSILAQNLNANSVDLSAFRARGGKIVHYHGWSDPLIAPQDSINYYERLVAAERKGGTSARRVNDFYRLFMVPGMYHCAFGPGPNAFGNRFSGRVVAPGPLQPGASHDIFAALADWVEKGAAPVKVIATKYASDQAEAGVQATRPICMYPNVARYNGSGDVTKAENFTCAPAPGQTDPAQVNAPPYLN